MRKTEDINESQRQEGRLTIQSQAGGMTDWRAQQKAIREGLAVYPKTAWESPPLYRINPPRRDHKTPADRQTLKRKGDNRGHGHSVSKNVRQRNAWAPTDRHSPAHWHAPEIGILSALATPSGPATTPAAVFQVPDPAAIAPSRLLGLSGQSWLFWLHALFTQLG